MKKFTKTISIAIVICVGLAAVCPAGSDVMEQYRARKGLKAADGKHPTVTELLDKYTQALDSTASFIEHYESKGEYRGHYPANHPFYSVHGGKKFRYKMSERGVRKFKENKGDYHHQYAWGYFNKKWKNIPEDKPLFRVWIHTMDISYFHQVNNHLHQSGSATWRKNKRQKIKAPTALAGISHLLGYIDSNERLDAILRKADSISVSSRTARVGGSDCFVIRAQTKYGQYTVWLDPEHGYHPAKVRHKAKEGEYTHHHIIPAGSIATGYLDVLQFEKVDDIWVPMEANAGFHRTIGAPAYYMDEDKHYKRTKIILNPDHDKLGSFADPILEDPTNDPELVNATRVKLNGLPTEYTWQDGAVVDSDGNKIDWQKIAKETKSVGR